MGPYRVSASAGEERLSLLLIGRHLRQASPTIWGVANCLYSARWRGGGLALGSAGGGAGAVQGALLLVPWRVEPHEPYEEAAHDVEGSPTIFPCRRSRRRHDDEPHACARSTAACQSCPTNQRINPA